MAKKLVERRICDFCDKDAAGSPCVLCHKDYCYAHGDFFRASDRERSHLTVHLCDVCAKDLEAKLTQAIKQAEAGQHLSQREA